MIRAWMPKEFAYRFAKEKWHVTDENGVRAEQRVGDARKFRSKRFRCDGESNRDVIAANRPFRVWVDRPFIHRTCHKSHLPVSPSSDEYNRRQQLDSRRVDTRD